MEKKSTGNVKERFSSLINNMYKSNLLNKYNITRKSNKLSLHSHTEKSQIKESVTNLKAQAVSFFKGIKIKNDNAVSPSPQSLLRQLQQRQRTNQNRKH